LKTGILGGDCISSFFPWQDRRKNRVIKVNAFVIVIKEKCFIIFLNVSVKIALSIYWARFIGV
jgi:hypothetical protein